MKTKFTLIKRAALLVLLSTLNSQLSTFAQGTSFTYQGRLELNGAPANGLYTFGFLLRDAASGGALLGNTSQPGVGVTNGVFTVPLDFGNKFDGSPRWLQITVATNGAIPTILHPYQPITPAPYAIFAANVALTNGAVDSAQLAGGAVTTTKLANDSVTSLKVADGTLLPADLNLGSFTTTFWNVGGNAGTTSDFIGTTDDQPFDVRVNNVRVMRYRLATDASGSFTNAPNVIGGSSVNLVPATVVGATIAGGGGISTFDGTAYINKVAGNFGTVGGGNGNLSSGSEGATVAGGEGNTSSDRFATVGGGLFNMSSGLYAAVAGGIMNTASGIFSTVSGGSDNTASGWAGAVGGGEGNTSRGDHATVPGGADNSATANYSFAAGRNAKADDVGSFVWADASAFDFHSNNTNAFSARCTGGARFVTAINASGIGTAGVRLAPGDTSWSAISDRNVKKNFHPVDGRVVLDKLAAMPVQSWNYQWEADTNTPHLGPMAQDFKAAFYPGRDDKSISTLEFDGVELVAIQGLNQKVDELKTELKRRDAENAELKQRLEALEKIIHHQKSN